MFLALTVDFWESQDQTISSRIRLVERVACIEVPVEMGACVRVRERIRVCVYIYVRACVMY